MIPKSLIHILALSVAGLAAVSMGGCAGEVADDDASSALEVDDTDTTSAALASPDPGAAVDGRDGHDDKDGRDAKDGKDRGECNDHGVDGHKHHRRHKFKHLDRLDGVKDGTIVIASLPPGLPERLIAKLHKIDIDGNGEVSKAEVKAAIHHGKHKDR